MSDVDFAAAAMLRLIGQGLARQGLTPPTVAPPSGAHVALADKRALAARLLQAHGPLVLLRIGEAVREARDEAVLAALLPARDPFDLLARWQRLERYIHSRHRIRLEARGECSMRLRHVSLDALRPPSTGEDLLVFGLLIALLEMLGAQALAARPAGSAAPWRAQGRWQSTAPFPDVACWELRWQDMANSAPAPAGPADADLAHRLLAADPGRPWTLRALAEDMALSTRSLQRRLSDQRCTFSALLRQVRLAHSARLLTGSKAPPAQIGYLCGFADQAHFTREFKRHAALTPARFRQEFAGRAPSSA